METTCGSLLSELQKIWNEIGESANERDKLLLELERECLDAYRRKVDHANCHRAQLRQQIADSEAELAHISTALGVRPVLKAENFGSLKEELQAIKPQLEEMQKQKIERRSQFVEVHTQINNILKELYGSNDCSSHVSIDESDLSLKGLEDFRNQLHELQREKLQDLGTTMVELWTLMDTPAEEQQIFQNVIRVIAASEEEISEDNSLSIDFLKWAEEEVERLQKVKSVKIKEVFLKKRVELEDLCRAAHIVVSPYDSVDFSIETSEAGSVDPSYLLGRIDTKISEVKEEILSRKEILDKVDKWFTACEEECWLEEYNRDDYRYNAGRGTHLMLKRAEKARSLVNKIPAMVETLASKVESWEEEKGMEFLYDGVGLLSMLEQYRILKEEKEQERQRQRDQKKLQAQLLAEKELRYGSKPSPSTSGKKTIRMSYGGKSGSVKQHQHTPHPKKSSGAFISSGKKDLSENLEKQHCCNSSNPRGTGTSVTRQPLSPLSSSNANSSANIQDLNRSNVEFNEAPAVSKTPLATPTKKVSIYEVNATPKTMPIPVPNTPSTVSIAMQTAMTPATPGINRHLENMEYSFEEKRAGFIPIKA
ncbi:hypothetical protein Leryth_014858 [Lithospermum erythrorhizon]|nr:hypothetical protein Leryth_014858 [Lithospermum erythrorhizon]